MEQAGNLAWIDLEMTGLDPFNDCILEIASIVTDPELTILAEGPVLAIQQPEAVLASMDGWNTRHHGESGLLERVRSSEITEAEAEARTLAFLQNWCQPKQAPLCGNSICQDRRFLARCMPRLEAFFHYRNLDVSSLKICARLWAPDIAEAFKKQNKHLALDDIRESIAELKHYRAELLQV
ncbi:oligoribonuclease [Thiohalocapsa halophila]|uniref:Oligoribonuclease n=1 Tax=Thiohalocapsa halophila TaxID=69359 RepID=A0ABS1CEK8_9GAMM|nr:oligoribonuclease [Thiohalocapsa halophila]MBK1630333.1 oligoribonuclease [Thiohalocapsa halophila]